jgi:predicted Zn-dependent protease
MLVISDHLLYRDLLRKSGQLELARAQAKEFILPPQTGFHVVQIADAYTSLDLPELAISYLKNFSGEYGFQAQSQYTQASLLIAEERWSDLHRFALEIRNSEKTSAPFRAFSYYLEGLSAIRRDRTEDAKVAFHQIRDYSIKGSNLGLYIGSNLWDLGFHDDAYAVLSPVRQRYANNATYWQLMLELSKSRQTASQMLVAAENLFRLVLDHLPNQINYASLLISQRAQLERAIGLTFDALIKAPNSLPVQVNYAQALVITGRADEAAQILSSIDASHFDTSQWQGFAFAWLTVHHQKKDAKKIHSIAKRVIPDLLLPGDRKYFEVIVRWARNHKDSVEPLIGING